MNKELLVKSQVDFPAIGEQITHELAAKMVKNHHDVHSVEESNSYYIGRNIIDQMLAQPGCVGIRFFDAINENGQKTLVYVGIDSKGRSILEYSTVNDYGKLAVVEGMAADKVLVDKPTSWWD
ncbi:MAG: hypothetical protein Q8918_18885 [Bacteroidota bacterium]|nr:hypothetical protein [Bacteroidota bacterium]MDP4252171.1 hypothetical protein [Bacteroidota bacterium]